MKKNILLAACFLMPLIASAQNDTLTHERDITLAEAIALARTQSVDAAVALNELKTAYWEYRTFRADLLPEVNFTGTLPNYNKSYSTYQNSDGSYSFVRNNTLGLSGALSIDQNIWFTGGKLSLASSLDYIKQLGSGGDKQFMSVPVSLELTQPIFGVNSLKWNRRIEPVRPRGQGIAAARRGLDRIALLPQLVDGLPDGGAGHAEGLADALAGDRLLRVQQHGENFFFQHDKYPLDFSFGFVYCKPVFKFGLQKESFLCSTERP